MEWLFGWLYGPIGSMLSWFSSLFNGSYAFALLLYALLFKIVFLPFSIKQQKNQIKMAKLTPKIQLIKAKYAGRTDQRTQQKMQQEIMEFQQKEGYNPLSGCLPMPLRHLRNVAFLSGLFFLFGEFCAATLSLREAMTLFPKKD